MPQKATFAKLKAKERATAKNMSKSEIQSWVSSAGGGDDGDQDEQVWQRDRVLNNWPRSIEYAQKVLLGQKTRRRVEFLKNEILSLAKHAGELGISVSSYGPLMSDVFRPHFISGPGCIQALDVDVSKIYGCVLSRRR